MTYKAACVAITVAILQGCATNPEDCDPSQQTGFLSTATCVGMYQTRQTNLDERVAVEKNINDSLQAMLASIDSERLSVAGERRGRESEIAELNRSWEALKASLEAKAQNNVELTKRIDKLQGRVNSVGSGDDLSSEEKVKRLDSLRRQVSLLMNEMDAGFYD